MPKKTIHLRVILSARYPKMTIDTPDKIVNVKVKTPNSVASPLNPKYSDIAIKLGDIILEKVYTIAVVIVNRSSDKTAEFLDFSSINKINQ